MNAASAMDNGDEFPRFQLAGLIRKIECLPRFRYAFR